MLPRASGGNIQSAMSNKQSEASMDTSNIQSASIECVCVCVCMCMRVCVRVSLRVCVCACVCMYLYTIHTYLSFCTSCRRASMDTSEVRSASISSSRRDRGSPGSYTQCDSFICGTWLTYMLVMWVAMWLIYMWDMTHLHVRRGSMSHVTHIEIPKSQPLIFWFMRAKFIWKSFLTISTGAGGRG